MKKDNQQNIQKGKFSFKDVIVILLSLAAVAGLLFIIKNSNDIERQKAEELSSISDEINAGIYNEVSSSLTYIVINEVNQEGWLELYNSGKEEIELSGMEIRINEQSVYTLTESCIIDRGGILVCELGQMLSEKDIIALYDSEDNSVLHMMLPLLDTGESYGAVTDGDIAYTYMSATKGSSNVDYQLVEKKELMFSVEGGFYDEAFQLSISAPEGYTVYYTLDGTQPTKASAVYSEPITITNRSGSNFVYAQTEMTGTYAPSSLNMGTVVRVAMANKNNTIVEERTETYFIGLANASDYKNMPVISITTNPENLFDYFEGIYVTGRSYEDAVARGESANMAGNYYNGWEKEAYIEFFEVDKGKTYEGEVSIRIENDYNIAGAQKSFLAKGAGAGDGSSLSTFLNDVTGGLMIQTNRRDNGYKLREYVAIRLLEGLSAGVADLSPCILFINGEYWGGYMLREAYDDIYIQDNYNTGDEDVIIVNNGIINDYDYNALYEEFIEFVINNDMSVQANYELVKEQMDIQSYLDYFCANMYLSNADFGSEEIMWRTAGDNGSGYCDGKWRWLFGKLDLTMDNGATGGEATASIDTLLMPTITQNPFIQSLLMNKEFCAQLSETMTRMADEVFTQEAAAAALSNVSGRMQKLAFSSYRRFYGNVADTFYSDEVNKIKEFFAERAEYILLYTEELVEQGGDREIILAARAAMEEGIENETEDSEGTSESSN